MSLAKSLKKAADQSIAKLGGDVTIRYVTTDTYNETTGVSAETTSDTTVKGIVANVVKSEVSGLVQAEDKRLTVAAQGLATAPSVKDRVLINSVAYQIVAVRLNEHANTAVSYELVLRS
tara:strand:- start:504 stop:860 length:357 start_codon:yes stop_codon:yes gene_type:complete